MGKNLNLDGTIRGTKSVSEKLKSLGAAGVAAQILAVQESTLLVHELAAKSIQDNGDGTPQVRYSPKRTVAVSKPGSPPNTDTGRLVQSLKFEFLAGGLIGRVGSNLKYAKDLEFGTKKMAARPWLSTALENARTGIAKIFAKALKSAIKE